MLEVELLEADVEATELVEEWEADEVDAVDVQTAGELEDRFLSCGRNTGLVGFSQRWLLTKMRDEGLTASVCQLDHHRASQS